MNRGAIVGRPAGTLKGAWNVDNTFETSLNDPGDYPKQSIPDEGWHNHCHYSGTDSAMDENQGNISCKRQFAATRLSGEPLALGAYGIQLSADEWTAYNFQSLSARSCDVALRVKARVVPCVLEVSVGEQTQSVSVTNTDWAEIALNAVAVPKGAGNLKYAVKQGTVEVDWAEFKVAGEAVAR